MVGRNVIQSFFVNVTSTEGTGNNNKYRKMMEKEEDEVQVLLYYLKRTLCLL